MRFQETQKVVVARAGIGGPVVYLTEDDDWTRELREAELILDEAHAQVRMLSPGGAASPPPICIWQRCAVVRTGSSLRRRPFGSLAPGRTPSPGPGVAATG